MDAPISPATLRRTKYPPRFLEQNTMGPTMAATDLLVVLVVEDEPVVRMDTVLFLEDAGFTVVSAANADQAIDILQSRNDIRLVFTDIEMPGTMDGLRLAAAVHEKWPPVRIIVTSGKVLPPRERIPDGARFIPKPYRAPEVLATMRGLGVAAAQA
jgi:CheY-like chemotaxis protein